MFGQRKKKREQNQREICAHLEEHKRLTEQTQRLEIKVNELIVLLREMEQKTISQKMNDDNTKPVSLSQIIDELLNGEGGGDRD